MACAAQENARSASARPDLLNESEELFVLTNRARAAAGEKPLHWDPALTDAALAHCRLMAKKGPIEHRYPGELNIGERAAKAGAHFSLIAENVAIGNSAAEIQHGWMNSAGHRANLLNPSLDRLGVAVVKARGILYAVEDFSRAEPVLTRSQVEMVISRLVAAHGVTLLASDRAAQAFCATGNMPKNAQPPKFLVKWQGPDLTVLPQALASQLASRQYNAAEVGSCAPHAVNGSFTVYRVAVLLY